MNGTLNKVMLIGNVGDEVKVHVFDENSKIGRLPLATDESYTTPAGERVEQTEWHNLIVRNKLADVFERYVKKGDKLYIEGKIRTRKWQDSEGNDRYTTEILVFNFTFLTPKGGSTESEFQKPQSGAQTPTDTKTETPDTTASETDDLPF